MQTKQITVQFTVEHNPGTDEHLDAIIENYLKGKGVDYKEGIMTI